MSDKMYQELFTTISSAANVTDWATGEIPVPIGLANVVGKTARCIELLKVTVMNASSTGTFASHWLQVGVVDLAGKTSANYSQSIMALDPRVLRWTYGTGNFSSMDLFNFQDQKGNGLLIPGDRLLINILNSGTVSNLFRITLSYRIKSVPLSEYLGLVNQFTANV